MIDLPCVPWRGHIDRDGYGVHWSGRYAHRMELEKHLGRELDRAEEVDHRCHTEDLTCSAKAKCPHRRCVNVHHLEVVTHAENVARGERARRTHCLNNHEYTDANTYRRPGGTRDCRVYINGRAREYRQRRAAQCRN